MLDIYNIEDLSISEVVGWVLNITCFRNLPITVVFGWLVGVNFTAHTLATTLCAGVLMPEKKT